MATCGSWAPWAVFFGLTSSPKRRSHYLRIQEVDWDGAILSAASIISRRRKIEKNSPSTQLGGIDIWSATVRAARPSPGWFPGVSLVSLAHFFG